MITDLLPRQKADFNYCEGIIREHSKSFYAAFSNLPPQKARCVYAIYAFCRMADDSIDEHKSLDELLRLQDDLEDFLAGSVPDQPVFRALDIVFQNYDMRPGAFRDMIAGQRMDYFFRQPKNQIDLEYYCYHVAGCVGLMLMPILSSSERNWSTQAIELGIAMQLTNILRDVGEDFENGRIYLPADSMKKHGYTEGDLKRRVIDERFIAVWEQQAKRAEALYRSFETALPLLDEDSIFPVLCSSRLYGGILTTVRKNGYNCFTKRAALSKASRNELLAKMLCVLENNTRVSV